ncbi:unnamed protein product [Clonostachys rosea]|uniref:Transcription factor domain-containing protein n=1 Tax=Bionectria ochroleuca TaxID=29856 RepID=A0ABY6U5V9_BIOOC|nr:unnamed protein product [Clonostachys rosea]
MGKLIACRAALQEWYDKSHPWISTANCVNGVRQHSVIVHSKHVCIFYYASRSLLSRQEALLSYGYLEAPTLNLPRDFDFSLEVQEAALGTIECLREVIQLDLARYLSLSMMAFMAVPLLLHLLDAKFFYTENTNTNLEARHSRLGVLIDVMKEYEPRYDGVEWVSYALRYAVNLLQPYSNLASKGSIASSTDLLTQEPGVCLRLILTIDLSLSKVKIPEDRDFPAALREILSPKRGPGQGLTLEKIGGGRNQQATDSENNRFGQVTGFPDGGNSTEHVLQQKKNSQDVESDRCSSLKSASGATGGDKVTEHEAVTLQELVFSFPELTWPLTDTGQGSSPMDETTSHTLTESLDFWTSCDELVVDERDLNMPINLDLMDSDIN